MRYRFLFLLCLIVSACLSAQSLSPAYTAYIRQWQSVALEQQAQYGIPAAITLAQGLLESGAGQSTLATEANNHFGIKCHGGWEGNTYTQDDDSKDECFRSYADAADSYRDHSLFLKRPRYEVLFTYPVTDYRAWARGLKSCGYATDPAYPQKLIRIIEEYGLNDLGYNQPTGRPTPDPSLEGRGVVSDDADNNAPTTTSGTGSQNTAKSGNNSSNTAKSGNKSRNTRNSVNNAPLVADAGSDDANHFPPFEGGTEGGSAEPASSEPPSVTWRPTHMHSNDLFSERATGRTNGRRFVVAQDGDTWGSIAYMLGMDVKTILSINEVPKGQALRGGDRIYLFPKRDKADRQTPRHLVQPGETAWDIAQRYGMKLSSIYKINGIPEGTPLTTQQYLDLR